MSIQRLQHFKEKGTIWENILALTDSVEKRIKL